MDTIRSLQPYINSLMPRGIEENDEEHGSVYKLGHVQWSIVNENTFTAVGNTRKVLPNGTYEIKETPDGSIIFQSIDVKTELLIKFPESNCEKVLCEIQKFWDNKSKFIDYKLPYRRGILLYGPPGSGKSCAIRLVMKDVIERNGLILQFEHPYLFTRGIRILREIQPETYVVVLMEDLDGMIERYGEIQVLSILDGVESIENIVFLATTNYPESLNERILNRPSRFDKRYKIDLPSKQSRKVYLEHLISQSSKSSDIDIDINKWVKDTEDMSIAHIKELFTCVYILGNEYKETIATLKEMNEEKPNSAEDKKGSGLGFKS